MRFQVLVDGSRFRYLLGPGQALNFDSTDDWIFDSMNDWSCAFETAPTCCAATAPSRNSSSVGMPRMLYFGGVCGFSSIFNFTTRSRSLYSSAMASSIGAIILQGPHHSAQKSSSTGLSAFNTSCSNVESLV